MYFLLDLCCKISKADAHPQAPCTAVAAAEQKTHSAAPKRPLPATPSVLDGLSDAQSSSAGRPKPAGSSQLPVVGAGGETHAQPQQSAAPPPAAAAAASALAAAGAGAQPTPPSTQAAAAARDDDHGGGGADPLDKVQAAFSKKPCRACTTAQDMLAAFRTSQFAHSSSSSSNSRGAATSAAASSPPITTPNSSSSSSSSSSSGVTSLQAHQTPSTSSMVDGSSITADAAAAAAAATTTANQQQQQQPQKQPFWFYEDDMPCPPDILELGRATWTLLHSVAAYYPDQPTQQQQQKMRGFVDALGEFYPCEECRGHLQKELIKHPPNVSSAAELSHWACRLHNIVNVRLGKPAFDCSKVMQRWRDGPADDEDACGGGGGLGH